MPTMRILLAMPAFGAKPVGETFSAPVTLPQTITAPIRVNSAAFHCKYVRVYNPYCYLSFTLGTAAGYTNVFKDSDGSAVVRDVQAAFTSAGNLLSSSGQAMTFTVRTTRSNWTGNYFGVYSPQEFWLDIDYTILETPSALTLDKANVEAGSAVTPSVTPGVGAARHTLVWRLGARSQETPLGQAWTVPITWLDQIPAALSGTASAVLTTYNSSGAQVGGPQTVYFTILCPEQVVPAIEALTVEGVNQTWGLYLKGRSKATLSISGAQGAYGSTIARYQLTGGGYSAAKASETLGPFGAGAITFTAAVTDTRGRTAIKSASITVTEYSPPVIHSVAAARCDPSGELNGGGASLRAACDYGYSAVGQNAVTVKIEYKRANEAQWTQAFSGALPSGAAKVIPGFSPQYSYEVRFTVADALNAPQITQTVSTAYMFMRWDPAQNAVGLGCYPEGSNRVQVAEAWALVAGGKDLRFAPCGTTTPGTNDSYTDCNASWQSGFYDVESGANTPLGSRDWFWIIEASHRYNNAIKRYGMQIAGRNGGNQFFIRNKTYGGEGTWCEIITDANVAPRVMSSLLAAPLGPEGGGTGGANAINGYYGLAFRGVATDLDTAAQHNGFWTTVGGVTAGTWPASVPNQYGVLVSYNTDNALNSGYRVQLLYINTNPEAYWKRHRYDAEGWSAWYKFTGTADV